MSGPSILEEWSVNKDGAFTGHIFGIEDVWENDEHIRIYKDEYKTKPPFFKNKVLDTDFGFVILGEHNKCAIS